MDTILVAQKRLFIISFSGMMNGLESGELTVADLRTALFCFGGCPGEAEWTEYQREFARKFENVPGQNLLGEIRAEVERAKEEGRRLDAWHHFGYDLLNALLRHHGYRTIRPQRWLEPSDQEAKRLIDRRNLQLGLKVYWQAGSGQTWK